METLSDFTSLPVIVARQSSEPFLYVIVPSFVKTDMCKTYSYCSDTDRNEERVRGDDLCYLVDMQLPEAVVSVHNVARTLDINSLPGPVQNALRRQWGS